MNFSNKTLEKLFRNYKWARNNSIEFLNLAIERGILDFKPTNSSFQFQTIRYQFQCLITTVDTYYRMLTSSNNQSFGVLIMGDDEISKDNILDQNLEKLLKEQIFNLEKLFQSYSNSDFDQQIKIIQSISNHEYLHQGQLLILFREAGVDLPERFKKALAL